MPLFFNLKHVETMYFLMAHCAGSSFKQSLSPHCASSRFITGIQQKNEGLPQYEKVFNLSRCCTFSSYLNGLFSTDSGKVHFPVGEKYYVITINRSQEGSISQGTLMIRPQNLWLISSPLAKGRIVLCSEPFLSENWT